MMHVAQFWDNIDRTGGDDACWPWLRAKSGGRGTDYGAVGVLRLKGGRVVRCTYAHRVAWMLTHGQIESGAVIRHTCDNPACCNPKHLLIGSRADNSRDMVERGRNCRGSRSPHAKLTENDVANIRAMHDYGFSGYALAKHYGVSQVAVHCLLRRKTWRHVA